MSILSDKKQISVGFVRYVGKSSIIIPLKASIRKVIPILCEAKAGSQAVLSVKLLFLTGLGSRGGRLPDNKHVVNLTGKM
jgi:hypothetical protein